MGNKNSRRNGNESALGNARWPGPREPKRADQPREADLCGRGMRRTFGPLGSAFALESDVDAFNPACFG